MLWDPFGQPLDPATLAIGTAASDAEGTLEGNTGWHQGALKQTAPVGSTAVIEMGARLYIPALGRFLQVDPIEGGVDNDYVWPTDPVGKSDLSGLLSADAVEQWGKKGYVFSSLDSVKYYPDRTYKISAGTGARKTSLKLYWDGPKKRWTLSMVTPRIETTKTKVRVGIRKTLSYATIIDAVGKEFDSPSMRQQYDCHSLGTVLVGAHLGNSSWEMESGRESAPGWGAPWEALGHWSDAGAPSGICNW